MKARALVVAVLLLLVVATFPVSVSQAGGPLGIKALVAPATITPIAGQDHEVAVEVRLADAVTDGAWVEVVLLRGATLQAAIALAPADDPLSWSGKLSLPYTLAPGDYTVKATVQDAGHAVATATTLISILPLAAAGLVEDTVDFAEMHPNGWAGPAYLTYRNLGNVPLRVALGSTAFLHEDGEATIPADSLDVRIDGTSAGRPQSAAPLALGTLHTGQGGFLELWLYVPSGAAQYVPPGAYTGVLTLDVEVAS